MQDEFRRKKFTHLFNILDFDHDGYLQESDFVNLGENIAILRNASPTSEIEAFVISKSQHIWSMLSAFCHKQNDTRCNLQNWIDFLYLKTNEATNERFYQSAVEAVDDIFFVYDKNEDSYISKQDFLCFFVSMRVEIKQADRCFRSLDLNKDDLISRSELLLTFMQFFVGDQEEHPGNLVFGDPEKYRFESRPHYVSVF